MHFGKSEGGRAPLETIFTQIVFKPLVFGSFLEMSSNVVTLVETSVEYGVEHLGRNMAATMVDTMRATLRMRYMTQLSMAAWRVYANLLLYGAKYVGTFHTALNTAHEGQGR